MLFLQTDLASSKALLRRTHDDWRARATKIGTAGWTGFKYLFFGPDAHLYAVKGNDAFIKGRPPARADDDWNARATTIGTGAWSSFQFLFFGPCGFLYAVQGDGTLIKSPAPTYIGDPWPWNKQATKIGDGWAGFKFLF